MQKAGKLVTGTDFVIQAIKQDSVYGVILAENMAAEPKEKIEFLAEQHHIYLSEVFSQQEISDAIGKNRKVLAIKDQGFAKSLAKQLTKGV